MRTLRQIRALVRDLRHGWLSVTLFYAVLTVASYLVYSYLVRLPEAHGTVTAWDLLAAKGSLWDALSKVWFIFAWGFGVQFLVQLWRVVRLRPREADIGTLLKHGVWVSAHAGFFEEIIFRVYAFLGSIIALRYLDGWLHGFIEGVSAHIVLPLANLVTAGLFKREFAAGDWALGMAVIVGSLFFRSAHIHYGKLSKANVWLIGMVMFWLVFNYGLVAAITAHFLYDLCVFMAIAFTSPFQRRAPTEPA